MVVLKELNLTISTLEGCSGLERTEFNHFTLEGCSGLERTDI